jgi:hypothetical protein
MFAPAALDVLGGSTPCLFRRFLTSAIILDGNQFTSVLYRVSTFAAFTILATIATPTERALADSLHPRAP